MENDRSFTALFLPVGKDARWIQINDINEVDDLIVDWDEFYPFDSLDIALICSSSADALPANRTIVNSDGPIVIYGDFLLVKAPIWADKYFNLPDDAAADYLEQQLRLPGSMVAFPPG